MKIEDFDIAIASAEHTKYAPAIVGEMAEFEEIYAYIARVEAYTGLKVTTVRSEKHTARSLFFGTVTKGKREGQLRGFPPTVGTACSYRRRSSRSEGLAAAETMSLSA